MNASAANMERIVRSKEHHDRTCVFGQPAVAIRMNPADVERCGWEDGDSIAGLTVEASENQAPGTLHVVCPGENEPAGELSAEIAERDLVAVGIEVEAP